MIRLDELAAVPHLGLATRVSPDEGDPWVRWVRVLEDPQDVDRLAEGELILTTARWRRSPLDTDRLVCALAQRRAAGLVLAGGSEDVLGELASACERWRLPLLALSESADPDEVARAAITLILEGGGTLPGRPQQRVCALGAALLEPRPAAAIVAELSRELGRDAWLLGRMTALGGGPPTDADLVAAAQAASGRTAPVSFALAGGPATAFAVTPAVGVVRPAAHLICAGAEASLSAEERVAIDEALAFLRIELDLTRRRRAARAPVGAEFVRRARSGEAGADELEAWTRALGVEPHGYVVCVVVHAERATPRDIADVASGLEDLADAHELPRIVIADDLEASAFLFVGELDERVTHALGRAKLALGPELARLRGALGSSSVIAREIADVMRLLHDARRVCQLNQLRGPEPATPPQAPAPPLSALLLIADDEARTALHQTVLEPLIAYDEQHSSELLRTLDVFLSSNAQWNSSAAELGVHVNTLRYRLTRIEKCTGRDLGSMADRVDFYVALRAREASTSADRAHGTVAAPRTR